MVCEDTSHEVWSACPDSTPLPVANGQVRGLLM